MLKSTAIIVVLMISVMLMAEACDIQIKIRSKTQNKFKIQVFIPSIKQKTERILLADKEEKKVRIKGENCVNKKWVVRTWKPDGNGDWVNAKQSEASIDGSGWMRIVVNDDLVPQLNDRFGIFCLGGTLCG